MLRLLPQATSRAGKIFGIVGLDTRHYRWSPAQSRKGAAHLSPNTSRAVHRIHANRSPLVPAISGWRRTPRPINRTRYRHPRPYDQ
jgi:hypothetical protein